MKKLERIWMYGVTLFIMLLLITTLYILLIREVELTDKVVEDTKREILTLFERAENHVETLAKLMETEYVDPRMPSDTINFKQKEDHYAIDDESLSWNITGLGDYKKLSDKRMKEIYSAYVVGKHMEYLSVKEPDIVWIYYISNGGFINLSPYVFSGDYSITVEDYSRPFVTLNTTYQNPTREPVWTNVYLDAAGQGLMVTVAKPVDIAENHLGVMAMDITLNTLDKLIENVEFRNAKFLIVSPQEDVLASSSSDQKDETKINRLIDVLPLGLRRHSVELSSISAEERKMINGYLVFKKNLGDTGYHIYASVSIWSLFLSQFIVIMPLILGGIILFTFFFKRYQKDQLRYILSTDGMKFEKLFNHYDHLLLILNEKGAVLGINDNGLRLVTTQKNDVLGMMIWDCPWWAEVASYEVYFKEVVSKPEGGKKSKEMMYFDISGESKFMTVSISPVYDDTTHRIINFIVSGEDKTEIRHLEDELDRYQQKQ